MIRLVMESYCNNCPYFEAKTSGAAFYSENDTPIRENPKVICEHKETCAYAVKEAMRLDKEMNKK